MDGVTVKELRLRKGMTQVELGEAVGIHVNAIINWENGKTQISDLSRYKVAAFFDVDPDRIKVEEEK